METQTPQAGSGVPGTAPGTGNGELASINPAANEAVSANPDAPDIGRLLELPLGTTVGAQDSAPPPDATYPAFDDADLPAPSFDDADLPAPSFADEDLPAPSMDALDMPVDLTTLGLDNLLGLRLSGGGPPTGGEVLRVAAAANGVRDSEPQDRAPEDTPNDNPPNDSAPTTAPSEAPETVPGELTFNDPHPLTEQAATNHFGGTDTISDDGEDDAFGWAHLFGDDEFERGNHFGLLVNFSHHDHHQHENHAGGVTVFNGTPGDDVLNGSTGSDILHGFAGDDTLDGGAGSDRLDGGSGNDVLVWDGADASIDGKNGTDTLQINGGDANLTTFGGSIGGIEIVDMASDGGSNTLTVNAPAVIDATDNGNTLTVTGGNNDNLEAGTGWTDGGVDGSGNHIYTQSVGAHTATLVVDPNVHVNANILM